MAPWKQPPAPGTTPSSPGADGLYHPAARFDPNTGKPIPTWADFLSRIGGPFGGGGGAGGPLSANMPRQLPPLRQLPMPGQPNPSGAPAPGGIAPQMSSGGDYSQMLAQLLGKTPG